MLGDQGRLEQMRLQLRRDAIDGKAPHPLQDGVPLGASLGCRREIGADPDAQVPRLADVENHAVAVQEPVDAGAGRESLEIRGGEPVRGEIERGRGHVLVLEEGIDPIDAALLEQRHHFQVGGCDQTHAAAAVVGAARLDSQRLGQVEGGVAGLESEEKVTELGGGDHGSREHDPRGGALASQRLHLARGAVADDRQLTDGLDQVGENFRRQTRRPRGRSDLVVAGVIRGGEALLLAFLAGQNRQQAHDRGGAASSRPGPLGGQGDEITQRPGGAVLRGRGMGDFRGRLGGGAGRRNVAKRPSLAITVHYPGDRGQERGQEPAAGLLVPLGYPQKALREGAAGLRSPGAAQVSHDLLLDGWNLRHAFGAPSAGRAGGIIRRSGAAEPPNRRRSAPGRRCA